MNNQDKLLEYIKVHIRGTRRPPSYSQMAKYLGLSESGARYHFNQLISKGRLKLQESERRVEVND